MEEKEKPPDDYFKCVKVPLKHVIKNPDINIAKIQEIAIMANKIVIPCQLRKKNSKRSFTKSNYLFRYIFHSYIYLNHDLLLNI